MGIVPTILRFEVRRANHCTTPSLQVVSQNIWFINVLQFRTVSVALLPRPNPTPDSKSPCKGLSEFVVGLSGTSVHKLPSFLYPHSHPHCVRFLRVFLGAPTPAPKKINVKINIVWFACKKEGKKQNFQKFLIKF